MARILKRIALTSGLFVVVANSVAANELSGTVRDVCGLVLPGTSVSATHGTEASAGVTADETGHYSFNVLAPGRWTITFALLGFETLHQDVQFVENGRSIRLNVRLVPDLLMKQELIAPHEPPTVLYRRYAVRGVVKAPNGEPVSAAIVRLQDVGRKKGRGNDTCTADELGRYVITAWSPVETMWQLSVQAEGFRSYTHPNLKLAPDQPQSIDLLLERLKPPDDRVPGRVPAGDRQ
jgi:hypothetical protein